MKPTQRWLNWAASNMSEGEKTAYNTAVNSKDMDTVKLAVDGLKAKFERANGSNLILYEGKATAYSRTRLLILG